MMLLSVHGDCVTIGCEPCPTWSASGCRCGASMPHNGGTLSLDSPIVKAMPLDLEAMPPGAYRVIATEYGGSQAIVHRPVADELTGIRVRNMLVGYSRAMDVELAAGRYGDGRKALYVANRANLEILDAMTVDAHGLLNSEPDSTIAVRSRSSAEWIGRMIGKFPETFRFEGRNVACGMFSALLYDFAP